jgi:predicted nucleic acid-binding protein
MQALGKLPELTSFVTTEACLAEVSWLLPNAPQVRKQLSDLVKLLNLQISVLDHASLERILQLQTRYQDLPMDFADGALVVACEKFGIQHVFTLNRRDFSLYRPSHFKAFHLLPEQF